MFLLHALNECFSPHPHHHRYATGEIDLGAQMDELPEIEAGLRDLDEAEKTTGRNGPYWVRIRAKILECSSSTDVEDALKEWIRNGSAWTRPGSTCELCGKTPIVFNFPIKNRVTGIALSVGSECIMNYLSIPGFGDVSELKRRLNGERNRLRKKDKGEIAEGDLALFQEASELEAALRERFAPLGNDFDFLTYRDSLRSATNLLTAVSKTNPYSTQLSETWIACGHLGQLHAAIAKRSKSLGTNRSLLAMVGAVMRFQKADERIKNLKAIRDAVVDLFRHGLPDEFLRRVWDLIREEKSGITDRVLRHKKNQEDSIRKTAEPLLKLFGPYPHLRDRVQKNVVGLLGKLEKLATSAIEVVEVNDFVDRMSKPNNPIQAFLETGAAISWLRAHEEAKLIEDYASFFNPHNFAWVVSPLYQQIRDKFNVYPKDKAGIEITHLRAFDQGLVEIGSEGAKKLRQLIHTDDQKALDILFEEVDDLKALRRKKLHDFLSERWGINVEKAFKAFSSDSRLDESFCEELVTQWERFPKLGPAFMAKIQRKMTDNDREVPNSMWDRLRPVLTRPVE